MQEIQGNYWTHAPNYQALVCTINLVVKSNGQLTMGKGIAAEFATQFKSINLMRLWGDEVTARWGADRAYQINELGTNEPPPVILTEIQGPRYLIGLPTKFHWRDRSPKGLVRDSIKAMVAAVDTKGIQSVLMTRPGCGNGRLDWPTEVRPICAEYLDARFVVIDR